MSESGFIRDKDNKDLLVKGILGKDYLKPDNNGYYHNHISKLYQQSINKTNLNRDFDFITDVIVTALKCFGTPNIRLWFEVQNQYASLTTMHKNFLLDMLELLKYHNEPYRIESVANVNKNIITKNIVKDISGYAPQINPTGFMPKLQLQQWPRFINYSEKYVGKNSIDLNLYFNDKSNINNLSDFITNICLVDNSIQDLLTRLYIIFGDRNSITNVSD